MLYGVSFGICNGLSYTIPLKICWDHYPERKGMVSGVIIGGFGLGSFLFGFISTMCINPHNKQILSSGTEMEGLYDDSVAANVMPALRTMVLLWAALIIIGVLLLKVKAVMKTQEVVELSLEEITQDRRFWLLYAMNFSTVFYGYLVVSNYKVFGSMFIHDDMFLTAVGSVASVCGSLRFLWSLQLDAGFSYVRVYGILCLVQLICSCLIYYSAASPLAYLVVVSISVFCEGGHFVLLPAHCCEVFGGPAAGVQVFSYLFSCFGLSSIGGSIVQNVLINSLTEPYRALFGIAAVLNLLALLLLAFYGTPPPSNDTFRKLDELSLAEYSHAYDTERDSDAVSSD